jgi:tRNA threonylcarbamoyladenosine biosynthesis protein TsaB
MACLGIDTSGETLSVGASSNGEVLGERLTKGEKPHSVMILPEIEALLRDVGMDVSDLNLIAVTGGPGRYTALRVGMATAKGLAYTLKIPMIRVSTLEALANSLLPYDGFIAPLLDARRRLIYLAIFEANQESLKRIEADQSQSYATAANMIPKGAFLTGDGVPLVASFLKERGVTFASQACMIHGGIVARLGEAAFSLNGTNDILEGPSYIRKVEVYGISSHSNPK